MNQPPTLWDKGANVQNGLRQPRTSNSASNNTNSPKTSHENDKSKSYTEMLIANSTLKADAPEFVPGAFSNRSYNTQRQYFQPVNVQIVEADAPRSSVQSGSFVNADRLNIHKQRTAPSNVQNPNLNQWQNYSHHAGHHDHNIDDSPDTIRLKQIISSLISYPGQFDDLLMVFMETIYTYFEDYIALSNVARLLVTEAINCPNFRYNGARLCWNVEQVCPHFRAELHLRCQKEIQENAQKQNVALFVAELYTQLPHSALYGALLINSLKQLLADGSNDNVKCVCQALKLTGFSLDQEDKAALDEVFERLKALRDSVNGSALTLLNSVIALREANWGRNATDTDADNGSQAKVDEFIEPPNEIAFQTDDQPLTTEEHEFLLAHEDDDEYLYYNEDPDELCDPDPEMTQEIQESFKEFVKLSKR